MALFCAAFMRFSFSFQVSSSQPCPDRFLQLSREIQCLCSGFPFSAMSRSVWLAIKWDSVSLFRFPLLSHDQIGLCCYQKKFSFSFQVSSSQPCPDRVVLLSKEIQFLFSGFLFSTMSRSVCAAIKRDSISLFMFPLLSHVQIGLCCYQKRFSFSFQVSSSQPCPDRFVLLSKEIQFPFSGFLFSAMSRSGCAAIKRDSVFLFRFPLLSHVQIGLCCYQKRFNFPFHVSSS